MRALIPVACVAGLGLFARFAVPDIAKEVLSGYQNPNFGPAPSPYQVPVRHTPFPAPGGAAEPADDAPLALDPRTGTLIPAPTPAPTPARKARPTTTVHPAERVLAQPTRDDTERVVP